MTYYRIGPCSSLIIHLLFDFCSSKPTKKTEVYEQEAANNEPLAELDAYQVIDIDLRPPYVGS